MSCSSLYSLTEARKCCAHCVLCKRTIAPPPKNNKICKMQTTKQTQTIESHEARRPHPHPPPPPNASLPHPPFLLYSRAPHSLPSSRSFLSFPLSLEKNNQRSCYTFFLRWKVWQQARGCFFLLLPPLAPPPIACINRRCRSRSEGQSDYDPPVQFSLPHPVFRPPSKVLAHQTQLNDSTASIPLRPPPPLPSHTDRTHPFLIYFCYHFCMGFFFTRPQHRYPSPIPLDTFFSLPPPSSIPSPDCHTPPSAHFSSLRPHQCQHQQQAHHHQSPPLRIPGRHLEGRT